MPRNLAIWRRRFHRRASCDSMGRIGGHDAAEEARDDEGRRSVPVEARPDHQHEARAGAARRPDRLGLARRRDCPALQRQGAARDREPLRDRPAAAQADLRAVRRRRLRVAGSTIHTSSTSPATSSSSTSSCTSARTSAIGGSGLGDKLQLLLAESLRVAHQSGALRSKDLKRVTIDTTVQPKNVTFPTDAKLLHAAIKGLNRRARRHGRGCGNPISASPSERR